jgi:hypothetical protein
VLQNSAVVADCGFLDSHGSPFSVSCPAGAARLARVGTTICALVLATTASAAEDARIAIEMNATVIEHWLGAPRTSADRWRAFFEVQNLKPVLAEFLLSLAGQDGNRVECVVITKSQVSAIRCAVGLDNDEVASLLRQETVTKVLKPKNQDNPSITANLHLTKLPRSTTEIQDSRLSDTYGAEVARSIGVASAPPVVSTCTTGDAGVVCTVALKGCGPNEVLCNSIKPQRIAAYGDRFATQQLDVKAVSLPFVMEVDMGQTETLDKERRYPDDSQYCAPTQLFAASKHMCVSSRRSSMTAAELKLHVGWRSGAGDTQNGLTARQRLFTDHNSGLTVFSEQFVAFLNYTKAKSEDPILYYFKQPKMALVATPLTTACAATPKGAPIACAYASDQQCQSDKSPWQVGVGQIVQNCNTENIFKICEYSPTLFAHDDSKQLSETGVKANRTKSLVMFRMNDGNGLLTVCRRGDDRCDHRAFVGLGNVSSDPDSLAGYVGVSNSSLLQKLEKNPNFLHGVMGVLGQTATLFIDEQCGPDVKYP